MDRASPLTGHGNDTLLPYLVFNEDRALQNFDSNPERVPAIILDRESQKWFRPAADQLQISYRMGLDLADYRPDFVVEVEDRILMLEPKRSDQMDDAEVLAKRYAAVEWCRVASEHSRKVDGKPWTYALIPHDAISAKQTLHYLLKRYAVVFPE